MHKIITQNTKLYTYQILLALISLTSFSGHALATATPVQSAAVGKQTLAKNAAKSVATYETENKDLDILTEERDNAQKNVQDKDKAFKDGNIITLKINPELTETLEEYKLPKNLSDFNVFTDYNIAIAAKYNGQSSINSTILKPGYKGGRAEFFQCSGLPLAIIIDIDDIAEKNIKIKSTSHINIQKIIFIQLSQALKKMRAAKITTIWLSKKPKEQAQSIINTLREKKLLDDSDFLSLKQSSKDRKQLRRQYIAGRYCIISILGNEKMDFDELFNYLKDDNRFVDLNNMYEKGWFLREIPAFFP